MGTGGRWDLGSRNHVESTMHRKSHQPCVRPTSEDVARGTCGSRHHTGTQRPGQQGAVSTSRCAIHRTGCPSQGDGHEGPQRRRPHGQPSQAVRCVQKHPQRLHRVPNPPPSSRTFLPSSSFRAKHQRRCPAHTAPSARGARRPSSLSQPETALRSLTALSLTV